MSARTHPTATHTKTQSAFATQPIHVTPTASHYYYPNYYDHHTGAYFGNNQSYYSGTRGHADFGSPQPSYHQYNGTRFKIPIPIIAPNLDTDDIPYALNTAARWGTMGAAAAGGRGMYNYVFPSHSHFKGIPSKGEHGNDN